MMMMEKMITLLSIIISGDKMLIVGLEEHITQHPIQPKPFFHCDEMKFVIFAQ